MAREYRHIEQYKKEILQLKEERLSKREIGEKIRIQQGSNKVVSANIST